MFTTKPIVKRSFLFVLAMVVAGYFVLTTAPTTPTGAQSADELRAQADSLEAQIAENEARIAELGEVAASLENKLEQLRLEINQINTQIAFTQTEIERLTIELNETEAELDRQKGLLSETLKTLYMQGNLSTFELLVASDSFSEFVNEQEYLERLKSAVHESAEKVQELKDKIKAEKKQQEELQIQQEAQRRALTGKQAEQQQLLSDTRGEEARYQAIVEDLKEQRRQAEAELRRFLAADNYVSLGYVFAGETIGLVGSSGFSTGPHLHFAIFDGANFLDPGGSGGVLTHGMQWPLPNSSAANITQWYGCVAPPDWYVTKCNGGANSFHGGLDVSGWYGDPVTAAADGDIIFRGWLGGYGNTVIIEHESGLFTYYPHLNQ